MTRDEIDRTIDDLIDEALDELSDKLDTLRDKRKLSEEEMIRRISRAATDVADYYSEWLHEGDVQQAYSTGKLTDSARESTR